MFPTCNDAGTKLCTLKYDAWGNFTIFYESGVASSTKWFLSDYCVFRYRDYYYDTETGLYYLQSRYYNPTWGRFLNADGYINANGDILGYNMFAYCSNNPVMFVDFDGRLAIWLQDSNSVLTAGHTGLLIQDKAGNWFHFYWGNSLGSSGSGHHWNKKMILSYDGKISLKAINEFYKREYGGEYESMIFIYGDFSNSVTYMNSLNDEDYNLINNNCVQVSIDVLRQGKFLMDDYKYDNILGELRGLIFPNLIYAKFFNQYSLPAKRTNSMHHVKENHQFNKVLN